MYFAWRLIDGLGSRDSDAAVWADAHHADIRTMRNFQASRPGAFVPAELDHAVAVASQDAAPVRTERHHADGLLVKRHRSAGSGRSERPKAARSYRHHPSAKYAHRG